KWADIFASAAGQWSSQTVPLVAKGNNRHSRILYGNASGRVRASPRDRFDALYSGSRIDLSNFGMPAGIEVLEGRRDAPSFVLPVGFDGESEADRLDFLQMGWAHFLNFSAIELRYGFSTAHLGTNGAAQAPQSSVELLDGAVTGAPPIENLAVRASQEIEGAWQAVLSRNQIAVGAGWRSASPRNRFTAPSNSNLITANGTPAFVVEFNTPLDSRGLIRSASTYAMDRIRLTDLLTAELGALADFSRGSLPAQSEVISWNSIAPRAGLAWRIPRAHGFVARGEYSRSYVPLAGRYLDFGNPNSLGGNEYALNGLGERGPLILRFGGPYSSISPSLRRPYADEFHAIGELPLGAVSFRIDLFRRDEKARLAAIDTGVPPAAFTPVVFDSLTVYSQNPATFGQDRYLLTNSQGLRFLNTGLVAEARAQWRGFSFHASFVAEKSYGPSNPGDAPTENDPGVIGSLFMDPNTSINASNRDYVDRGYVGKIQASYRLPGGIEVTSVAVYLDGLVFAPRLLVTGLAQGPIVVAATVRGSPEGGNRAEYVLNWNVRLQREFPTRAGTFAGAIDILNVTNEGQKIQENDIGGPDFVKRLPVAIQAPRAIRLLFGYEF
ncbi:MAG: hypothetical protein ACRD30_09235, partial [Bryobacteraceae bacterium]